MKDADLQDELLLVAGRKSGGKKRAKQGSDGEEGSDDVGDAFSSDSEDARPAKKPAAAKKRQTPAAGEDSDVDSQEDDEEQRKMAGMTELEREMYLFEREERRERERERRQLVQQAQQAEQVEVRASSRRVRASTGTDNAIGKLAAARQQREQRVQSRKAEKQAAVETEAAAAAAWGGDEPELSSEEEEAESEEAAAEPTPARPAAQDKPGPDDEEGDYGADDPSAYRSDRYDEGYDDEDAETADLESILTIQLRRQQLEAWHREPFFDTKVVGCVVRIACGEYTDEHGVKQPNYMLMRVTEVTVRNSYRFGSGTTTNKWLRLEESGMTRAMNMSVISNQDLSQGEYERYLRHCAKAGVAPMTRRDVARAEEQLQEARTYKYTTEDIQSRLQERRAKGEILGSLAAERVRLLQKLEAAKADGNDEEIEKFEEQLADLERRGANPSGGDEVRVNMATINQRNRQINFQKALDNVSNRPAGAGAGTGVDVFSRRQTRSTVYWNTRGNRGGGGEAEEDGEGAAAQPEEETPDAPQEDKLARSGSHTATLSRTLSRMEPGELIKVLDIRVDLSLMGPALGGPNFARKMLGPKWRHGGGVEELAASGRTVLTYGDWKRKMQ